MSEKRFYIVQNKQDEAKCLVEAGTFSGALRRSAEYYCSARIAKPAEIIELMRSGCDIIEVHKGEQEELPFEEPEFSEVVEKP